MIQQPRPARALEEPADDAEWKAVDQPPPHQRPPLPTWAKAAGIGLLGLLLIGAVLLGTALAGGFSGQDPTPSPSPTPALLMDPPVQVGDWVRGDVSSQIVNEKRIVRADYAKGSEKLVLMVTWVEPEVESFLTDAGITLASASPSASATASASSSLSGTPEEPVSQIECGESVDTATTACGRVINETGLLVAPMQAMDVQAATTLLEEFEQALTP